MLATEVDPTNVAAVVMELVAGEGGFLVAPRDFVHGVAEECKRHGMLLVVDEIQTGFGRTGRMFASEHYGIEPDIVTLAKSLAAGLPLAAVVGRADVMDAPQPGGLGGTFAGNALACAACLATLDVISKMLPRAQQIGEFTLARFEDWKSEFPIVGDVRGLGPMAAIELVRDRDTKAPASTETDQLVKYAYEHGVVKAGSEGSVIPMLSPLTITDTQLSHGLDVVQAGLASLC